MKRWAVMFCLFAIAGGALAQETRYVTDSLQLGLFASRDGSGDPLRNLVSGAELVVLERIPNYARVRTADGDEGWVKSAFLVEDKPARLRMAEVEAELAMLAAELDAATLARESAERNARAVVERAESELAEVRADQAALAELREDNAAYLERIETYRGALPWPWVAAALVVALGAGFVAGHAWLDASIRRRHGGFRVY